jgi:mRNA-degrading endonuclease RelE of RelBE toxin-antitoxin system
MAGLQVVYHPEVIRKDIPSLDPPVRKRIKIAIEQRLATRPEEFAKPLAYNKAGLWALRVGSWRIIFALREAEVWVLRIGHRSEVYSALDREIPESP